MKRLDHRPGRRIFESIGTESKYSTTTMVYGLIRTVQASLKYRGGWKGLLEHMYTVSPPIGGNAGRGITQYNHWYL